VPLENNKLRKLKVKNWKEKLRNEELGETWLRRRNPQRVVVPNYNDERTKTTLTPFPIVKELYILELLYLHF
jgi:hypothetical protein